MIMAAILGISMLGRSGRVLGPFPSHGPALPHTPHGMYIPVGKTGSAGDAYYYTIKRIGTNQFDV